MRREGEGSPLYCSLFLLLFPLSFSPFLLKRKQEGEERERERNVHGHQKAKKPKENTCLEAKRQRNHRKASDRNQKSNERLGKPMFETKRTTKHKEKQCVRPKNTKPQENHCLVSKKNETYGKPMLGGAKSTETCGKLMFETQKTTKP